MSAAYRTACEFADHAYPVVPVRAKVPLVGAGGFHQASTDPGTLRQWHNRWPSYGWAAVCGHGFVVVDVDVKDGADVQEVLTLIAGPMVETGQANGSGRGLHVYAAGNVPTGHTALHGVEVRGVGSYVVLPGSPHESGVTYEWVNDLRPWTPDAMAPLPPALTPRRRERVAVKEDGRIPNHTRDVTLASLAGTMRGRGMVTEAIYAALLAVNRIQCDPPLPERQIAKIARSASTWELGELPAVTPGELVPVDLVAELAKPQLGVPWMVEGAAARGMLTTIAGRGDVGKSWLALQFCEAVHAGGQVAGIRCTRGRAVYLDFEMGRWMVTSRLRLLGMAGDELTYYDLAGRLDLAKPADQGRLARLIDGYDLAVIDSLRRAAPSAKEDQSDSMGPVMGGLATIARRTGAALILVHHQGGSDKPYRGSTAIWDQSDALLSLQRGGEEGIIGLRVRGNYGRMKFAPTPADRWLKRHPLTGRLSASKAVVLPPASPKPARDEMREGILRALPAQSKRAAARALGTGHDHSTFRAAWANLEEAGAIRFEGGQWVGRGGSPPSDCPAPPHPDPVLFGEEE